ncbi:DUF3450 family protein [Lentisphaera profundi]|uniref:DUF3450 family protein n=1 Tax=Lentisphaera profundi TaxID=1658616 RepID=A0ABY7VV97_9BACT|nr:DUF3450 family protein [Lentisphaera profundi]WDE97214.1 DUF3450 family protein [Lentisphaera profundi]
MKTIYLFLVYLPSLLFAQEALTQKDMLELIKKTNDIDLKLQNQDLQWQEEKQVLNLQIKLIKQELDNSKSNKQDQEQQLAKLHTSLDQAKKQQALLTQNKKAYQDSLEKQKNILISQWQPKLPKGLVSLIQNEYDELNKSLGINQTLANIQLYTQSYLELQSKVHVLSESHIIEGKEWQLSCLYIGTAQGYFINKDKSLCGTLNFKDTWQAQVDSSMLKDIETAFAQTNRDGRPALVNLKLGLKK